MSSLDKIRRFLIGCWTKIDSMNNLMNNLIFVLGFQGGFFSFIIIVFRYFQISRLLLCKCCPILSYSIFPLWMFSFPNKKKLFNSEWCHLGVSSILSKKKSVLFFPNLVKTGLQVAYSQKFFQSHKNLPNHYPEHYSKKENMFRELSILAYLIWRFELKWKTFWD